MPMSPYAVSKLATEQYAMAYAKCYGLPVLPFPLFQRLRSRAATWAMCTRQSFRSSSTQPWQRRPLPVNGDGEQSRDFTYVGTLVETVTEAILGRVTSSPTNLAFGTRTTLNELIALIGDEIESEPEVVHSEPRPGDVRHSQADNSLLRSLLPKIEPISLQAGLAQTVYWMRKFIAGSQ